MLKQTLALVGLLLSSLSSVPIVHASSLTYSGDTTEASSWFRPENNDHPPSIRYDVNPRYGVLRFEVSLTGNYDIISNATLPYLWDNYLFLYEGGFDPLEPQDNFVILNDDYPIFREGIWASGFDNITLMAHQSYYLVTSGFGTSDFGQFTNTISGPGDITAVPVPAAAWLFGSALLGLAGVKRRHR